MEEQKPSEETIMAALSTLTPHQFSDLTHSLSSILRRHHHRLYSLLRSPSHFSQTLHHLETLSLHQKTLLIARHLHTTLKQLTRLWDPQTPTTTSTAVRFRDLDAVLLLMLLCELRRHNSDALDTPPAKWRLLLCDYVVDTMLTLSGIGVSGNVVLCPFIDVATRCRTFLDTAGCGGGGEVEREVATSPATVVGLPAVEISGGGGGGECVICREEMREGRDVCELPCEHLFHWICILPWLKKRNTCPCCRFRLPTDDVFGEIQRLWAILVRRSGDLCG